MDLRKRLGMDGRCRYKAGRPIGFSLLVLYNSVFLGLLNGKTMPREWDMD